MITPPEVFKSLADETARQARDYLMAYHEQEISLQTLAQACGTDRFRLTRAFKAAYGLAPHAWLIQLRLSRGRQMLAAGVQPVDVASRLGFADQSHLGRWFVRAYGITPGAYQQRAGGSIRR
ncbi:AraC-like DNA-binding protein [Pseudomonas baetica]|uniref:AraC-like DNA-binding protein n=1 Tax=Pseudomonas baetica TaxID=674054 RepID=A0ABX4PVV4_9PSED|nr:AraC-like DNA-binding protein [Pseudomonas baetica]